MKPPWLLLLPLLLSPLCAAARAADVAVSINPLHSLVQSVMGDTGEAVLLLGGGSPHVAALKPSQAAALSAAQLVFYVGGGLEPFLPAEIPARQVALLETDGLLLLPLADDSHGHENEHDDAAVDLHIWLDINNAKILAEKIAEELSAVFPQHRAAYAANADELTRRLDALDGELRRTLTDARGIPYIVFHNAYRYFERRYGMAAAGVVFARPGVPLSARRLQDIYETIRDAGAACVFREPQFSARQAEAIARNGGVRAGSLDPLGADIPPSTAAYFQLMRNLASDFDDCLL